MGLRGDPVDPGGEVRVRVQRRGAPEAGRGRDGGGLDGGRGVADVDVGVGGPGRGREGHRVGGGGHGGKQRGRSPELLRGARRHKGRSADPRGLAGLGALLGPAPGGGLELGDLREGGHCGAGGAAGFDLHREGRGVGS